MRLTLLLLATVAAVTFAAKPHPVVTVPSFFRWDSANTISVTPIGTGTSDINVKIESVSGRTKTVVFQQKYKSRTAGSSHTFSFVLKYKVDSVTVTIDVDRHSQFHCSVLCGPDVEELHVQTDKAVYKAGEHIHIRALPLTSSGQIYPANIQFSLQNPDGFELLRRQANASGRGENHIADGDNDMISLTLPLPEHLLFGEWRVLSHPSGTALPAQRRETVVEVKEYSLPPFNTHMHVEDGDDLRKTTVWVGAFASRGAPIHGSLSLSCEPGIENRSKRDKPQTVQLVNTMISNGSWTSTVDASVCFPHANTTAPVTFIAEIRDRGTGSRGVARAEYDALASRFDIVPLRPGFGEETKQILITTMAQQLGDASTISVDFTCLGPSRRLKEEKKTVSSNIGKSLAFSTPENWSYCHVIQIEAYRTVGSRRSRVKSLVLPNLQASKSLQLHWIQLASAKAHYKVGEKFDGTAAKSMAGRLNYMVVCNARSISAQGRVRDDGVLNFQITSSMIGGCVVYVFTADASPEVDMVQIYINDDCKVSTMASKDRVRPGDEVTFSLNGAPHGVAILRAADERLQRIQQSPTDSVGKTWYLGFFNVSDASGGQIRLSNLLEAAKIKHAVIKTCSAVGSNFAVERQCPGGKETLSHVSDLCMQYIISQCNRLVSNLAAKTSPVRDRAGKIVTGTPPSSKTEGTVRTSAVFAIQNLFSGASLNDPQQLEPDEGERKRFRFPQVWLFDSHPLGSTGTATVSSTAPDLIGTWSVTSSYWSPTRLSLCRATEQAVTVTKKYFMQVDLPRAVYVNESITVKVAVTADGLGREEKFSICYSTLSRRVCADKGSFGQKGQPTYTRVTLDGERSTETRTFGMRMLSAGAVNVTFQLRREESFPGRHHCDVGQVVDTLQREIIVQKRADTEEHYKRVVLNAEKPVTAKMMDALMSDAGMLEKNRDRREVIEVEEYRLESDPTALYTELHSNLLDTDTVYSLTVDLAKFLPTASIPDDNDIGEERRRRKRGILDFGNSYLSDVLKKLSVQNYNFKNLRLGDIMDFKTMEKLENSIAALLSDLLRFSDCNGSETCGFGEFGKPQSREERDVFLSSIATSLLCTAEADPRLVCPALRNLNDAIGRSDFGRKDMKFMDLPSDSDALWLHRSMLLQVSKDCAAFQCLQNSAWTRLYRAFYADLDETLTFDPRVRAALAFMATESTNDLMRAQLNASLKANVLQLPFWSAGIRSTPVEEKLRNGYEQTFTQKQIKSGDVLVNSLGTLAFVAKGMEKVDFDPLADWIYEQRKEDDTYENALDTYFAHRSLFEYRAKKNPPPVGSLIVELRCDGCETRTVNVTDTSSIIYLPTSVKRVTLVTRGRGKVKAGVRLLASKRQRNRRQLTQDDYYPVRISVSQEKVGAGTLRQIVCLYVLSPVINTLEITHGLFTGYSTTSDRIQVLSNTSMLVDMVGVPSISSFAAHFVLKNLSLRTPLCYAAGISEPATSHEPGNLAPVAITARHPINDVIGQILIAHPDTDGEWKRRKRSTLPVKQIKVARKRTPARKPRDAEVVIRGEETERRRSEGYSSVARSIRSLVDNSVDTVCFEGGECACAETTCSVRCGQCARIPSQHIKKELCQTEGVFGAYLTLISSERRQIDSSFYTLYTMKVNDWIGGDDSVSEPDSLSIWLRGCNRRCEPTEDAKKFLVVGRIDGLVVDQKARMHYVLQEEDRFETAVTQCGHLLTQIVTGCD